MKTTLVSAGALLGVGLLAFSPSSPAASRAEDPLYYELEALGWGLTERFNVPGVAIGCIRGGELVWTLGCGYADLEKEELVEADTLFNIGSCSKTVAAWGAMKLVEKGELELDAPVESYLTRWKLPESEFDPNGVTLRRLLSHTAGLSLHGYPGFAQGAELPTIEESLNGATNGSGAVRQIFEPGTAWKYSGGGYTITQLLIEELSGATFAEYMRAAVLQPLGMETSDYRWTEEVGRLAATPYDEKGEPIGGPIFTAQAAASLQTSVAELARFCMASMPAFRPDDVPELLSAETLELMQTSAPVSDSYGLGYGVQGQGGLVLVGHSGANSGWMSSFSVAPATGDGLIVLTNGSNGQRVIRPIMEKWRATLREAEPVEAASGR